MLHLGGKQGGWTGQAAITLLIALHAASARAAEKGQPPAAANDIVVTAQRRNEAVVTTPIAITALTGAFIEQARLRDMKDIVAFTPGFSGNSDDSYIDGLAIRGIVSNDYGIGGDPSIGIFKDGIYQGRSGGALTSLYDIERAEALRGPQGFLFGRNAISGAISVVTVEPEIAQTSIDIRASYASRNREELEAALNLPLGEEWAFRLSAYQTKYDGWVSNLFAPEAGKLMGGDRAAARASLLYDHEALRFRLTAEHERRRQSGTPYRAANDDREVLDRIDAALGSHIIIGGGPDDVDSDLVDPRDDSTITSMSAQADLNLGIGTLTSITAYRRYHFFYSEDYDGTPLLLGNDTQRQHGTYASQEIRLVSPDRQRLTWSLGLSGYREKVRTEYTNEADENFVCTAGYGYADCGALTQDLFGTVYSPAPGGILVDTNEARSTNTGFSVYGDANFRLLPKLVLGAGLRYSLDHKHFGVNVLPSTSSLGNIWTFTYFTDGFIEAARSWAGLTPRLYVRYAPSSDLNVYASVTRGYKAGGFGTFTVAPPGPITDFSLVPPGTKPDPFAPETVWSKELGLKGNVLDHRLQFDVTAFHYVYSNLQSNFFNTQTRTQQVTNVGKVHGYGIEAAITALPTHYLDIHGNLAWTHTRESGDRNCNLHDCGGLPNPTWAGSGMAKAHLPTAGGEAFLQGEWIYEGHRREAFDWRGITRRTVYSEVNLRLGYTSNAGWGVTIYVQNLLDRLAYRGAENGGDLTPANDWGVTEPRNLGLEFRWSFRR